MVRRIEDAGRATKRKTSRGSLARLLIREWQKQIPQGLLGGNLSRVAGVHEFVRLVGLKPTPWLLFAKEHLVPRLRSSVDVDDVLQDAFVSALLASSRLHAVSIPELVAWFKVIVVRALWRSLRTWRAQRQPVTGVVVLSLDTLLSGEEDDPSSFEEPESRAPGPHEVFTRDESLERIIAAMLAVRGLGSTVVILVDALEATLNEAAEKLGLTVAATTSILRRAREKVRPVLEREGLVPSKCFRTPRLPRGAKGKRSSSRKGDA